MNSVDHFFDLIKERLPQALVRLNEPLSKRTTLRVGGCADVYVEPSSEEELAEAIKSCGEEGIPFMALGRGSNLLVRDGGFRGMVICLAHPAFSAIAAAGAELRCGAGARLKTVAAKARELNIGGLEFLDGIPGSVGGALRMNAGAMGCATFEMVTQVRFMDRSGAVEERGVADVPVEYRSCPLFKTNIVLSARFRGRPDSRAEIAKRADEFNKSRWGSQPKEPSAGCIFKNPSKSTPAGRLIDELGLKGERRGGASVSSVHGNFIVNDGTATAADVLELIEFIKSRAKAERGIELREEVEIIGE
ncbi:MAG TPA: UDP-N-acetylmuramate dehydrogenase [Verrucomicrobiae bacterium]|jgi:UDP-N-acetylenolpyruvoylglucosamine reductase|nr:UDP-N-acetylmuramate dehydrogenase [Verrucomicrobiae bacterium]